MVKCEKETALDLADSDGWEEVREGPEMCRCTRTAVTSEIEGLDLTRDKCAWHVYQEMFAHYRDSKSRGGPPVTEVEAANRAAELAAGLAVQSGVMGEEEAIEATGVWLHRSGFELADEEEEDDD